ncbi:MAG: NAD(P)/FAD-dependent oxidoreductase [Phycisphaerales bacterium]
MRSRRVVILGAGFGGIACAKALRRFDGEVVVVDRTNHHLFQPLLYQVATAGLSGSDIAQPVRTILRGQRNARVCMAAVERVDLAAREVVLEDGQGRIEYDYLVIALGVQTSYFGKDQWRPHTLGLKTLGDAHAIRDRVLGSYERAECLAADPRERARLLSSVVIGAGPTGVEMAGALAELARRALKSEFKLANLAEARVVLVDGGPRVLPTFPPELSARAQRDLERMGVRVVLNAMVSDIGAGYVVAGEERFDAATVIWAAGVAGPKLTGDLAAQGVRVDRSGRVEVGPDLLVRGAEGVYAVGDIAACTDGAGARVPGVAQGAMQMGRHVGRVIAAAVDTQPNAVGAFVYRDKGTMATIGRTSAVADFGKTKVAGVVAWLMWLFIHLLFLIDLRSKLTVLLKWVAAYLFYRPSSRLIESGRG